MPDLVIQIFWITPRTNFKYFKIKAYLNLDLDPNLKLALNYNLFKKYDFSSLTAKNMRPTHKTHPLLSIKHNIIND